MALGLFWAMPKVVQPKTKRVITSFFMLVQNFASEDRQKLEKGKWERVYGDFLKTEGEFELKINKFSLPRFQLSRKYFL